MSAPIPLIGKATKWRQLCQPIRAKTDGPEPATIARDLSLLLKKVKYRPLIKEKVFLVLFAIVFEEQNLNKSSKIWKNEQNYSIIRPKKEQCYWHN